MPGEGLNVPSVPMTMPDLSTISDTVKVVRWLVAAGQPVRRGDHLLEVETDKATMIVESSLTGTLTETLAAPGQEVAAGQPIATVDVAGAALPPQPEAPPAPPMSHDPQTGAPSPIDPANRPPERAPGSFFARNRQAARPGTVDEPPASGEAE
jgi:pyruvate/2-oxoglutarate dehydrogenase complex dihydrolipoamide acyltransferase (E2) component